MRGISQLRRTIDDRVNPTNTSQIFVDYTAFMQVIEATGDTE